MFIAQDGPKNWHLVAIEDKYAEKLFKSTLEQVSVTSVAQLLFRPNSTEVQLLLKKGVHYIAKEEFARAPQTDAVTQ